MSKIFVGTIVITEDGRKSVKFDDQIYNFYDKNDEIGLSEGTRVQILLEKKIFADKTEILAKLVDFSESSWDIIYQKFLKSSHKSTFSDFHRFLKENYYAPTKK